MHDEGVCQDNVLDVSGQRGWMVKVVEFENEGNDLTICSRSRQTNYFLRGVLRWTIVIVQSIQSVCLQPKWAIGTLLPKR